MRKKYTPTTLITELIMLGVCIVFFVPIYYLFVNTFKTRQEIVEAPLALPTSLNVSNYVRALESMDFFRHFFNSMLITSVSVVLIVILGSMAAYTIARRPNRLTKFLRLYFLIGFMVPLQTTILPLFLIMKNLGLINTYQGLIFLHSNGAVFALFLYGGFIRAMPRDMEEAAFVDGAGPFRTFWQIVFPLLRPVTATLIIFNSIWIWNDFILSYLFLYSNDKATLTMQVYNGIGLYYTDWSIMMPVLALSVSPVVIFYIFMQRHIVAGLTAGALRG